jgi:hypothetical protein
MTNDFITVFQARRRRLPSLLQSIFQKVIGRWMFAPDGNCRHGSQSGRVVYKKEISIRHDYVMRELVLSYYFRDVLRMDFVIWLCRGPCENLVKAGVAIDLARDQIEFGLR